MTWPAAASSGTTDPPISVADRWISRVAAATVAGLAAGRQLQQVCFTAAMMLAK
jgi:hypothetical protein